MRSSELVCALLLGLLAICSSDRAAKGDEGQAEADRSLLKRSGAPAEPADLLAYVNDRCGNDADLARIDDLVRKLADDDFGSREDATRRLIAVGYPALPRLGPARYGSDAEAAGRARACVEKIEARSNPAVLSAAVRVLLKRSSADVAQALLRYLPYACDQELAEDIWYGLDGLPLRQRGMAAVFAAALRDKVPVRRAAAGFVLGRRGDREQQAAATKLLRDDDPGVRLRVAQGLLGAGRRMALPVLVALLEEGDIDVAWQAEELLHWAAGKESPCPTIGAGTPAERKRCRRAWWAWWADRGRRLDVASLLRGPVRPVLCLVYETVVIGHEEFARVWLCGSDGRPRWGLDRIAARLLTQVTLLPGGRVLFCETGKSKGAVVERDLKGVVRWRHAGEALSSARRLPTGNTFITDRVFVREVTPEGKVLHARDLTFKDNPVGGGYPQRLRSGHLLFQQEYPPNRLTLYELDPVAGRVRKKVEVSEAILPRYTVRPLPNGHFLVMSQQSCQVREVNGDGKVTWRPQVDATDALRQRDGNTLIAGIKRVAEIDPEGKIVWEALGSVDRSVSRLGGCFGLLSLGFDGPAAKLPR